MAWTQAEYEALKAAIAQGAQSVQYMGRTVTYHSLKDMRDLLAEMARDLSTGGATSYRLAATRKGV